MALVSVTTQWWCYCLQFHCKSKARSQSLWLQCRSFLSLKIPEMSLCLTPQKLTRWVLYLMPSNHTPLLSNRPFKRGKQGAEVLSQGVWWNRLKPVGFRYICFLQMYQSPGSKPRIEHLSTACCRGHLIWWRPDLYDSRSAAFISQRLFTHRPR